MASILRVFFPAGFKINAAVMKFKADKVVDDAIAEIVAQHNLGDPLQYLLYIPSQTATDNSTNNSATNAPPSPSAPASKALWAKGDAPLSSYELQHRAIVQLRRKNEVSRVRYKTMEKGLLFDWSLPLEHAVPYICKRFDVLKLGGLSLYTIEGTKLDMSKSLCAQEVPPNAPLEFRLHEQQNAQLKPDTLRRGTTQPRQDSANDDSKNINIVNLGATVKAQKDIVMKGWLVAQNTKKSKLEKRYATISEGHLFLYKTNQSDAKPADVLNLAEFSFKDGQDDVKKKAYSWELINRAPELNVAFCVPTDKEKADWTGALQRAIDEKKIGSGPMRTHKATKADLSAPKKPATPKGGGKVFGRLLEESVQVPDGSELPSIVMKCVDYIDEKALDVEGIFRLSGSSVLLEKYVGRFDKGEDVDLSQEKDPHAISGLLKMYFRDMPEPLLTYSAYSNFIAAAGTKDLAVQLRYVRHLINNLPVLNRELLQYLLTFLRKVASHSEKNKMALHNLATVFAPNLLKKQVDAGFSETHAFKLVVDTPYVNTIVNILIRDFEYIFEGKSIDASLTEEGTSARCCRALYDYKGSSDEELTFEKGNIVKIIHERNDGWWIGEFKVGHFGRFPASYVKKWSEKQSEAFTKRQQFKLKEATIKRQLEQGQEELKQLNEEKEQLLYEIDSMNLRKAALDREFYGLKKTLEPLLRTSIVIPKPETPAPAVAEVNVATPEDDKDDKKKGKKGKKADKKADKKKAEKKDKKADKKADKKDKKGAAGASGPATEEGGDKEEREKRFVIQPPQDIEGKKLDVFPKFLEDFLKQSEDHRRALHTVDQTKDVFLTSLELLLGSLPPGPPKGTKDTLKKKGTPEQALKASIEDLKLKTKSEAAARALLSEQKDNIVQGLTDIRQVLRCSVLKKDEAFDLMTPVPEGAADGILPPRQTSHPDGEFERSSLPPASSFSLALPASNSGGSDKPISPRGDRDLHPSSPRLIGELTAMLGQQPGGLGASGGGRGAPPLSSSAGGPAGRGRGRGMLAGGQSLPASAAGRGQQPVPTWSRKAAES